VASAISADAKLAPRIESMNLGNFETYLQCLHRQAEMLKLFGSYLPDASEWRALARCDARTCGKATCTEACYLATINRRLSYLDSGLPILEAHKGPKCDVSLVHPLWEAPVGKLSAINMAGAAQWTYRRLKHLAIPGLVAMGIFEVSLNRNLGGEVYWAGGIHQIIAGASESQLRRAFKIDGRHRQARPNQRMVHVTTVERIETQFAYAQKRFVEQGIAYKSSKTGRQDRFPLPLRSEDQVEHDAWLLTLPIGARTVLYGCSRKGTTIFPAAGGGV